MNTTKRKTVGITIPVDASLYREVTGLLKSDEGVALYGPNASLDGLLSRAANSLMNNLTFALRGSGYRRALAMAGAEKGGRA